ETQAFPPRYRSPRLIGRGAMGDIFSATDDILGREVVVKVLSDRYAADEGIRERFKREGLAAARLSGEPGAVTIFDVGEWQERPFIVMEYLAGGASTPAGALSSLAGVASELLSGHRPFERESPTAEAAAHVNAPVPSIAERCKHLPYQVDAVFQRALAKDPRKRYGSAREFVA